MKRRNPAALVRGTGAHRRTENDYMAALLDTVSLEDWRAVVAAALAHAKEGDPQARAWLAQYLVGRPEAKAPTPLTVVVGRLSGADPLTERLARPFIQRALFPSLHPEDEESTERAIKATIAEELAALLPPG